MLFKSIYNKIHYNKLELPIYKYTYIISYYFCISMFLKLNNLLSSSMIHK